MGDNSSFLLQLSWIQMEILVDISMERCYLPEDVRACVWELGWCLTTDVIIMKIEDILWNKATKYQSDEKTSSKKYILLSMYERHLNKAKLFAQETQKT